MTKIEWTDAERDAVAYRLAHHYRVNPPAGDCSCGHVVPLGHSFPAHQADEALNALSDLAAARIERAVQDYAERERPVLRIESVGEAKNLIEVALHDIDRRVRQAKADELRAALGES